MVNLYAGRTPRLRVGERGQASDQERGPVGAAQEPHQLAGLQGCHRSLGDSISGRRTSQKEYKIKNHDLGAT